MNVFEYWFAMIKRFVGISVFPTWKTITLGVFKDRDSLLKEVKERGFGLSDEASYMMDRPEFAVSPTKTDIDLVACKLAQLGIESGTPLKVRQRARRLGLYPCPAEVALQLCLILCPTKTEPDPPKRLRYGGVPIVVSEPISGPPDRWGKHLRVFEIWCDEDGPLKGPRFIGSTDGDPRGLWTGEGTFIFARRPLPQG